MELFPRSQPDAFAWKPPSDQLDFGPHPHDWPDPIDERKRDRRRIRVCLLAFSLLGFALLVASLTSGLSFFGMFRGVRVQMIPESWRFVEATLIVWLSFVATCLLWGRWRDRSWQLRTGVLVGMGFVDLVLWSMDHAVVLGLTEQPIGHDWFRESLGHALGWAELSLMGGLAADVAAHLHLPQALDFARGVRSVASIGGTLWLFVFFLLTRWQAPIWPLRIRGMNRMMELTLLWLGEQLLFLVCLVQVTALCLSAAYACSLAMRRMLHEDRTEERLRSPSEAAWDEFNQPRPPDFR